MDNGGKIFAKNQKKETLKRKMKNTKNKKNATTVVPVFFAADENYMPFLGITLTSLLAHADPARRYAIHVLYTGKLGANAKKIAAMARENASVEFHDVGQEVEKIGEAIHCRDYYTSAIYFRLFIPELFLQYHKAVYLDCDTILRADISKLYDIPLGENYIGAVADPIVAATPVFGEYVKRALGIDGKKYFNSGVVVMQLDKLRSIDFCHLFARVLHSYDFVVAPDQDCLNLICKDKVRYYGKEWNTMPLAEKRLSAPKLVHYNLSMKPWRYEGVAYEEYFWETAKTTPFYEEVLQKRRSLSDLDRKKDALAGEKLLQLAKEEADNPNNYDRTVGKRLRAHQNGKKEGGTYGFIEYFGGKASAVKAD